MLLLSGPVVNWIVAAAERDHAWLTDKLSISGEGDGARGADDDARQSRRDLAVNS
jgi:hypothetical protein